MDPDGKQKSSEQPGHVWVPGAAWSRAGCRGQSLTLGLLLQKGNAPGCSAGLLPRVQDLVPKESLGPHLAFDESHQNLLTSTVIIQKIVSWESPCVILNIFSMLILCIR